jgi:hypothetical protein
MPIPTIPVNAILEASIIKGLTSVGTSIANQAISNASKYPHIQQAISVGEVKSEGGRYTIEIRVDASKGGPAPEAAAFEYGSGIHNPDNPKTYKIAPKNKNALAFFWDKVDESSPTGKKFRGISKTTGKAIFNYVDHPGVEADPYLKPAINSFRTKIPLFFGGLVSKAYRNAVPKVTVIK